MSPIEIRLTKDKLSLISQVLSNNNDAYKHTEVIMDLVHRLGFRDDVVAEVKVFAMLADTALQFEDLSRAYEISERMVDTVLNLQASHPSGELSPEILEANEVCWVACFQLGRQAEFTDLEKKLSLLGRAMEFCPPEKLHDVLTSWRRLQAADVQSREARISRQGRDDTVRVPATGNTAFSLKSRLQNFHLPSPPLLNTPDAAALASRTFKSVAANFPFSVGSHSQYSDPIQGSRSGTPSRTETDVSGQATQIFQKGIGWLIGADDDV